jgi:hypothetical protein
VHLDLIRANPRNAPQKPAQETPLGKRLEFELASHYEENSSMKNAARPGLIRMMTTAVVVLAAGTATAPAAAQDSPATIADLNWIAGTWSVANGNQTIEEHWTSAASNAIVGLGRTLAGDRMVAFEYLRIEARADGVFYVAQPNGRAPTSFRLTKWDGQTAVFENPDHDFPKRIMYTKSGNDAVTALVDGGEGTNALTFTYTRIRS